MKAVIAGVVGGAVGAAIWAGVVSVTNYELGWIAWGIGGLVGYCVAFGNRDGALAPTAAGGIAVAMSALSILGGKYAGVQLLVPDEDELLAMFTEQLDNEEFLVSYIADDVVVEFESAGRDMAWPPGTDPTIASTQSEYPANVWAEAESRWASYSADQRADFRGELESQIANDYAPQMPEFRAAMAEQAFRESFGGLDILFFGLAMVTAFGIGNGSREGGPDVTEAYLEAMKRVMIAVMLADGLKDESQVRAIGEILGELTGAEVSDEQVSSEVALIEAEGADLASALRELAPMINDTGKAMILQAALRVASADGGVDDREGAVLSEIAAALGVSEEEAREMLAGPAPAQTQA